MVEVFFWLESAGKRPEHPLGVYDLEVVPATGDLIRLVSEYADPAREAEDKKLSRAVEFAVLESMVARGLEPTEAFSRLECPPLENATLLVISVIHTIRATWLGSDHTGGCQCRQTVAVTVREASAYHVT